MSQTIRNTVIGTLNVPTQDIVLIACTIVAGAITANSVVFQGCSATGANTVTSSTISFDRSSAKAFQLAGGTVSSLPTPLDPINPIYGHGGSGALVQSSGSHSGADAEQWSSVTITSTGNLALGNAALRCNGLLDLSAAPASAITSGADVPGGNATAGAGGTGGAGANGVFLGIPGALSGVNGANGVVGAGAFVSAASTIRYGLGGSPGGCGASGTGVNAGQSAQVAPTVTSAQTDPGFPPWSFFGAGATGITNPDVMHGGQTGRSGSSGGGDNVSAVGGGGGGSAPEAPSILIYARGIKISNSTPAAVIKGRQNNGGNGGNGAASGSATGGGAGAGGSGGAGILIAYEWLIGVNPASGQISAPGGTGGTGGNGNGSGASAGGDGGTGGGGGQIVLCNTITGVRTRVTGSAGSAGSAHASATGGAGGSGGTCTANFF